MDRNQTLEALAARAELRKTLPTINYLETRDLKIQLEASIKEKFDAKMKVVNQLYQDETESSLKEFYVLLHYHHDHEPLRQREMGPAMDLESPGQRAMGPSYGPP